MSERKWVNKNNFDENIQIALQYFEGIFRDDVTFDHLAFDALGDLGFEVTVNRTNKSYDGNPPGGFITIKWGYENKINEKDDESVC